MLVNSACADSSIEIAIKKTVTFRDIVTVAQKVFNDSSVQVLDYNLNPYSANKLGFLGSHRQLTIKVKINNGKDTETAHLFVKSLPYDCKGQVSYINDEGIFIVEYNFFSSIAPQLLKNYECDKWSPICYLAKTDSLIMEDLRCQGYKLRTSFFDSYVEIKSVLAALARLHCCSMIAETRINQSEKITLTLKDLFPNYFNERAFKNVGKSYLWVSAGINIVCMIGEQYDLDLNKLRKGFERLFEIVGPSKTHRNVVCHGDLWTNNIMFDDSQPLPKCVLVDYQLIRYAPPVIDILQMMYLHTSRQFRKKHENSLITFYHSILAETADKSDLKEKVKIPTVEEVFAALHDLRIFGPASASLYIPLVLMDPEILQRITDEVNGFENFLLGDRIEETMFCMKKDESFKNKLLEVINELSTICNKP